MAGKRSALQKSAVRARFGGRAGKGTDMSRILPNGVIRARTILLCGAATLALTACVDGFQMPFAATTADSATQSSAATELVERDVEAPEIFQVTGEGLWDGRPSLGGVWVAHPDVADPERVIIRNPANGQFVIGALFRRERDNPGPELQASSDAAEALGMLAGAPATLNVTALRREEAAVPADTAPISDFATADTVAPSAPDTVTATSLDGGPATPAGTAGDPIANAAEALAAATPPPATAPTASALNRPFIQIGIFSVEANADRAGRQMTDAGLSARVIPSQSQGRDFWRVVVGPASGEAARATALDQVKALGYTDAYFVSD